jgi:hypothetical protein
MVWDVSARLARERHRELRLVKGLSTSPRRRRSYPGPRRLDSFHVGEAGAASSHPPQHGPRRQRRCSLLPTSWRWFSAFSSTTTSFPRERLAVAMASPARLMSVQRRIRWLPHVLSERSRLKCFWQRGGLVATAPVDAVAAA